MPRTFRLVRSARSSKPSPSKISKSIPAAIAPTAPYIPNPVTERRRVLVKFPTRARPQQFFICFERWVEYVSGAHDVTFLVTVDEDDKETLALSDWIKQRGGIVDIGNSKSKIEAVNVGIAEHSFDVLIVASDDMWPQVHGYDAVIVEDMERAFPDFDGALHYHDGYRGDICTLPVMGRKLYDRFGYVYHPAYQSLWCLDGDSLISTADHKLKKIRDIVPGERVVGAEGISGPAKNHGRGPRNKLVPTRVTQIHTRLAETVIVTMASGASVCCTPDHLWGCYGSSRRPSEYGIPKIGRGLIRVHKMPGSPPAGTERDLGWLAGMYDGEGSFPCIRQSAEHNPENCAELERVLSKLGFQFVNRPYTPTTGISNKLMNCYYLVGGRDEYFKFLEWVRPIRNFTKQVFKRMFVARFGTPDKIVSIVPSGLRQVYCLTTESGNFVAEGLLSHNCDNEYTEVVKALGKHWYSDRVVVKHEHPFNVHGPSDSLLKHNNKFFRSDHLIYMARRERNFDMADIELPKIEIVDLPTEERTPVLSLLIPTVPIRKGMLDALLAELNRQIAEADAVKDVEIRVLSDNGVMNVGRKRNSLLESATGDYTAFIDDDDKVAPNYISVILNAIRGNPGVDCVTFDGVITTNGGNPKIFRFDLELDDRTVEWGYERRPNHLCPVRAELSKAVRFPSLSFGEDANWSKRLKPLLKTQARIDETLYFYRYSTTGTLTGEGGQNKAKVMPDRPATKSSPPQIVQRRTIKIRGRKTWPK